MFIKVKSHGRSFVKALSWRCVGSIDTFALGYLFTGSAGAAVSIAGTEVATKVFLYYFHERIWEVVKFGKHAVAA